MTPFGPARHRRTRGATGAQIATAAALLATAGCALLGAPHTQRTEFFVLSAAPDAPPAAARRGLAVGIGPISMPDYLSRPEMVIRIADNQLVFDEYNRWAEPLKNNFVHVLAADLDALVGFDQIVLYPWYQTAKLDYAIGVSVLRFERSGDNIATLVARWTLRDGKGAVLVNRESQFSRRADDPTQTAAALSAMTADLARDIAGAIAP